MRALIFIIFFIPLPAFAAAGEMETTLTTFAASGAAAINPTLATPTVSNVSSTVTMRSPSLLGNSTVLSAALSEAKNDYSGVIITNAAGVNTPLAQSFNQPEASLEVGSEYKQGSQTGKISYGQMLTDSSPFWYRVTTLEYSKGVYANSSVFGMTASLSTQHMPLTYFTNPTAGDALMARRQSLDGQKIALWYEQIFSQNFKSQFRVLHGERSDRPEHWGAEVRNANALSDRLFSRLDIGFLNEQRNEALTDDRGYFAVYWIEAQIAYELTYDFLLTASLGTTIEREDIPFSTDSAGNSQKLQVGTDTFGLRLAYKGRGWNAGLLGQYSDSNTTYSAWAMTGNLAWEI